VAESLFSTDMTRVVELQSDFLRHNRNVSDIRHSVQRQCHVYNIISFNEEDSSLLGCYEVAVGKHLPTFQGSVVPPKQR
jgi:predicted RNA binding protein with dsRBD fold (UPF0201 family)